MFRIFIVGASHGKRLGKALRRHQDCGTVFQVFCYCVPGKPFYNLIWPDLSSLLPTDLLIVIPFGNDLVERRYIQKSVQDRKIHLTQFVPRTDAYFVPRYQALSEKLKVVRAKVRILNNFYRHLCCPQHKFTGWVSYQNKINKEIVRNFTTARVKVLDHRSLLGLPFWKAKVIQEYSRLQSDSVHFWDYMNIANNILLSLD